ncbi:MAG: COX15/CtaA family protein [Pseudomonadota bacterium]
MAKQNFLCSLAMFASFFALGVIALGAFTRLIDAGLGCPDWPGCYGHLVAPLKNSADLANPIVAYKAWAEMVHRYFVGALSLLILTIILTVASQKKYRTCANGLLALGLIMLLVYQILLGQWTVTQKLLPMIVSQHLLGGFLILAVLWLVYLTNNTSLKNQLPPIATGHLRTGAVIALMMVLVQIALGAWTSTNYASFSCADFPLCMNDQSMVWHFKQAYDFTAPVGVNYEGGVLPESIRQTIQMTHRLGALILTIYLVLFVALAARKVKKSWSLLQSLLLIIGLLCLQLCIGITNVIFKLPLLAAISHNLVAVLLLLAVITVIFKLTVTAHKVAAV